MTKRNIYYKVCSTYDDKPNRYFSFNVLPSQSNELCIEYIQNKWTEPVIKGSRLYCFKTLRDAQTFRSYYMYSCDSVIFSCYANNVATVKYISFPSSIRTILSYINKKLKGQKIHISNKDNAPTGTLSASSIMILEKVR